MPHPVAALRERRQGVRRLGRQRRALLGQVAAHGRAPRQAPRLRAPPRAGPRRGRRAVQAQARAQARRAPAKRRRRLRGAGCGRQPRALGHQ